MRSMPCAMPRTPKTLSLGSVACRERARSRSLSRESASFVCESPSKSSDGSTSRVS